MFRDVFVNTFWQKVWNILMQFLANSPIEPKRRQFFKVHEYLGWRIKKAFASKMNCVYWTVKLFCYFLLLFQRTVLFHNEWILPWIFRSLNSNKQVVHIIIFVEWFSLFLPFFCNKRKILNWWVWKGFEVEKEPRVKSFGALVSIEI